MKLALAKGSTSVILTVFIQDSSSVIGAGLSGLDETSSIVGGYVRMGGTGVALAVDENVTTEGTYQAPSTAAQVRIGTPANMPTGFYELHFHDDLFATGAESVVIGLSGAANMVVLPIEVQLTDPLGTVVFDKILTGYDPNNATDKTKAGGMIRAIAAWINDVLNKDHSAANPEWVARNEDDSADLIKRSRTVAADIEKITPGAP